MAAIPISFVFAVCQVFLLIFVTDETILYFLATLCIFVPNIMVCAISVIHGRKMEKREEKEMERQRKEAEQREQFPV